MPKNLKNRHFLAYLKNYNYVTRVKKTMNFKRLDYYLSRNLSILAHSNGLHDGSSGQLAHVTKNMLWIHLNFEKFLKIPKKYCVVECDGCHILGVNITH